jgi:hypothetical protein
MMEVEWLAWERPEAMLEHVGLTATDRQLRLFGCACCRLVWQHLTTPGSREAVELSEQYADGLVTKKQLAEARLAVRASSWNADAAKAHRASWNPGGYLAWHSTREAVRTAVERIVSSVPWSDHPVGSSTVDTTRSRARIANLLRDIFNPFRPVAPDPVWLTSDVVALARGIYEDRAFDRMPILADALQDAGCTNEDVLSHCRGAGPHVRGCWVVDLVLGKQ